MNLEASILSLRPFPRPPPPLPPRENPPLLPPPEFPPRENPAPRPFELPLLNTPPFDGRDECDECEDEPPDDGRELVCAGAPLVLPRELNEGLRAPEPVKRPAAPGERRAGPDEKLEDPERYELPADGRELPCDELELPGPRKERPDDGLEL